MVRLKDIQRLLHFYCKLISIPYGAIKSRIDKINRDIICKISIPYGAIKRDLWLRADYGVVTFQFLMVRLKV